jgi:hypothetical protein
LSRLATAFVLGYHGCERSVAEKAVDGEIDLLQSDKSYDWLGPGAYFWESDPQRAWEWSKSRNYREPAVVGAVIDLRNCLDLLNREDIEIVRSAHASFMRARQKAGLPIPENKPAASGREEDRVIRLLDCAVLRHLHEIIDRRGLEAYDTVRAMFREGGELYAGSGFHEQTHTQVAVRNSDCILGLFWPRPYPG